MNFLELENELRQIKHESLFAQVVREDPKRGIEMIKDQIQSNRSVVVDIVGEKLVAVIEQINF